jgi:xanthine/uracil/vitamin C permease (AzgA family)
LELQKLRGINMQWILDNLTPILGTLLGISETTAAIVQIVAPQNKGVSGLVAGVIKLLQLLGAKNK